MGKYSDFFRSVEEQAAQPDTYLEFDRPAEPAPQSATTPEATEEDQPGVLSDAWSMYGVGSNQLLEGLGWLVGSDTVQDAGRSGQEYWRDRLSDRQQEANEKRFIEDDFGVGDAATDWRSYMGILMQSAPHLATSAGGAAVAGRGALALGAGQKAATTAGTAGAMGAESATIGSMVGADIDNTIREMSEDEKMLSPLYQELRSQYDEAEATDRFSSEVANPAAWKSAAVGGAVGYTFNRYLSRAVLGRLKGGMGVEATKGAVIEGATELAQEGSEGYISQRALNDATGRPMDYAALANQSVAGLAAGTAMGAGTGAAGSLSKTPDEPSVTDKVIRARTEAEQAGADDLTATRAGAEEILSEFAKRPEPPAFDAAPDIGGLMSQAQAQMDGGNAPDLWAPSNEPRPYDIAATAVDMTPKAVPLSEQVGAEPQPDAPKVVYDQDGISVTQTDQGFEALTETEGGPLVAYGEDAGEARRRLTQLIERNAPQAPVLQNRDRSTPGYVAQMDEIANNPDYDQVSASKTAESGAPMAFAQGDAPQIPDTDQGRNETITMSDGAGGTRKIQSRYAVVEADQLKASNNADGSPNTEYGKDGIIALNNGRTAGLQEAYNRGTAEPYREAMQSDAEALGIDPQAIASKQKPVLVRLFDGAQLEGIADPGAASNTRLSADLSMVEQARTDARKLSPEILSDIQPGDPTGSGNTDFVRRAAESLSDGDKNTRLRDSKTGLLTAEGQKRIRGALIERAYTDETLTRELVEATDSDLKTLGDALAETSGRWALMREQAKQGAINPDMDITDALTTAINMIRKSRQEGQNLKDLAGQIDAFAGETDQMAAHILSLFYRGANFNRIRSKDAITGALNNYIETALQSSPGADMFGEQTAPQQILEREREQTEGTATEAPTEPEAPRGVQPDGADNRDAGPQGEGRGRGAGRAEDAEGGESVSGASETENVTPEIEGEATVETAPESESAQETEADETDSARRPDSLDASQQARLPEGYILKRQTKGPFKGRWRVIGIDGFMGSIRQEQSEAVDSALEKISTKEASAKAVEVERKAQKVAADKIRAGNKPTREDWKAAGLADDYQLDRGYVYQSDVSPFLVEYFDLPKNNIRKNIGEAAGNLRSDMGNETPIVYLDRLHEVFGGPAEPAPAQQSEPESGQADQETEQPTQPIEDFGEKIEGARKDYASKLQEAKEKDVSAVPLSESWPEPDYQKLLDAGADPQAVGMAHAARDAVPPKPRKGWKLKGWTRKTEALRNFTESVISGEFTVADLRELARKDGYETLEPNLFNMADLYAAVGHGKSLKGLQFANVHYTMYEGKTGSFDKWQIDRIAKTNDFGNMPRRLVAADTKDDAIKQFLQIRNTLNDKPAQNKQIRFDIYSSRYDKNDVFIGKKIGKDVVRVKEGFESVKEAREYLSENQGELENTLDKMKNIPDHRKANNSPRVGKDHRNGGDVTPEAFADTFGFRGVQFGNYVEQGRRQQDLNEAYDGLMDLAGILNIPARALSLSGELGLAFGARGKGGKTAPKAHYEPGQIVINLTKKSGAGSLAHEWFHALDNYFARERGSKQHMGYATDGQPHMSVRPEVAEAFRNVRQTVNRIGMKERSKALDKVRTKAYWSTDIEMSARAFESYVIERLKDQSASNDYLANIVSEDYWKASEALGVQDSDSYPYPEAAEIPEIRAAYDNLFEVIETRDDDDGGVEMFSRDGEYRRTQGATPLYMTKAEAQPFVDSYMQDWKGKPDVMVEDRIADFPADLRAAIRAAGAEGDMRAVLFDDHVYILAPRIPNEQALQEVVLHEVVGHYGLHKMMGSDLKPLLNQVYMRFARTPEAKRIIRNYFPDGNFNASNSNHRQTVGEELLAHLAETNQHPKLWNKIVSAVREGLRKLGFTLELSETDLLNILRGAQRAVEQGGFSKPSDADVNFSRDLESGALARIRDAQAEGYDLDRLFYHSTNTDALPESVSPRNMAGTGPGGVFGAIFASTERESAVGLGEMRDTGTYAAKNFLSQDAAAQLTEADTESAINRATYEPLTDEEMSELHDAFVSDREFDEDIISEDRIREILNEPDEDIGVPWLQQRFRGEVAALLGHDALETADEHGVSIMLLPGARFLGQSDVVEAAMEGGSRDGDNEPMFSRMGNRLDSAADHFNDLDADQKTALGKIAPRTPKEKAQDWLKERTDRWSTKLRQGMIDRFAALKDVDEAVYGRDVIEGSTASSSWVLAQMSGAASGALQSMLTAGRLKFNAQEKVISVRDDASKGLNDVLKKLGNAAEIERFFGWIAGNRSARLMAEGRENLFEPEEVDALKRLNQGQTDAGKSRAILYQQVFKNFQQYRDDVLEIAEATGIITAEQRETWANEFYVPFYRLADNEGGFTGPKSSGGITRQEAYKKLKGGSQNLNDLLENTMMNFHHLLQAGLKNQAALQALDNAETLGIAREVKESDRDTENSTFVLRDGEKTWYEIDDPLVFKAVTALAHPGMNSSAMKVMRGFKRLFTNLTTTTPQFVVANLLRDSMQAAATSEVSKNFLGNMVRGSKAYGNQRTRAKMMASGGSFSFGHLYGENADEMRLQITGGLARADILRSPSMVPDAVRGLWRKWNEVTEFTENINRAAIYEQNAKDRGELYAAFKARDLMNFSQYGAYPAMRILIDVVPFLNARLQGLDKIYRSGVKPGVLTAMGKGTAGDKQATKRFWAVTGALALASMALYLRNQDDDEYQKLEEWQKDTYWFFRVSEDHAIFIPKPFEVGAIATLVERLTEQAVNDKATGELFAERLGHMLMDTFSFSPVPQIAQPALDVYANYDAFTGRPIEGMGMERLSPELRRRNSTTAPAIAGSRLTGVAAELWGGEGLSPVQMDHLIQGYFGSVGSWVAGTADTIWKTANGETAPDRFWYENQPIRRFYKNLGDEDRYTRYGTVFYEALKETNRVYADIREYQKLGDLDSAMELVKENRNKLVYRRALNRVQGQLRDINAAMQQIQRSDQSSEYKRRELDRLRAMKNRIQEQVGRRLEQLNASSS